MAIKKYQDAEGNTIEVDDEISLIGPPPPQEQTTEASTPNVIPRRPKKVEPQSEKNWRTWKPEPEEVKHAGNTGVNDPAFRKLLEGK